MQRITHLLVALIYGLTSQVAWAGCADLDSANKWTRIDNHKVVMYRGSTAIALLEIPYCYVNSGSDIRLVKPYVCNWDKIIVDGEVCDIRRVEKL